MSKKESGQIFSQQLEAWLYSDKQKTLTSLGDIFLEKSFAVLFLILMALPALPVPTGGLTHIFEIIAMLLALELVVGRQSVWLPKRWRDLRIAPSIQKSTIPRLVRIIQKLEKYSRPRWDSLFRNTNALRIVGILVFIFCLFAFIAPPFSGLDTLPSLAVVAISLSIILDDFLIFLFGLIVGIVGVTIIIGVGTALVKVIF